MTNFIAITPNGDCYNCPKFTGHTNMCLGNVYEMSIKDILSVDNILKENFIEEMNKAYQSGIEVGMGYRNTINIHDGWVASCSALLFAKQ